MNRHQPLCTSCMAVLLMLLVFALCAWWFVGSLLYAAWRVVFG